jgi:hypothetical protein
MSEFVVHPQAYTDLEEICEYIAADSGDVPAAAAEAVASHRVGGIAEAKP